MLNSVVIGDLHLDGLRTLFPNTGTTLQISAIERVLDYAASKGINRAIYLGDISDRSTLSEDSRIAFLSLVEKYRKYLKQDIILGNHDISSEGSHSLKSLKFVADRYLEDVTIYTVPTQVEQDGVLINYLPYPHTHVEGCGKAHLNIAHIDRAGAVRDNGYKIKKGPDLDTTQYWVIGHLHTPQTVGKRTFFPGTLYQMAFGESLPKGFAHLKVKASKSGKALVSYDWIEQNPPYRLTNLAVDSVGDLDQIASDPNHLYKLFIGSGVDISSKALAKYNNVVNVVGYSNKEELKTLLQPVNSEVQLDQYLDHYIDTKGLGKAMRKRVLALNTKLLTEYQSGERHAS